MLLPNDALKCTKRLYVQQIISYKLWFILSESLHLQKFKIISTLIKETIRRPNLQPQGGLLPKSPESKNQGIGKAGYPVNQLHFSKERNESRSGGKDADPDDIISPFPPHIKPQLAHSEPSEG